jgi:hypothetical protein
MKEQEHEGIESKSEKFKKDEMSPLEKYLVDREALVIMITLNVQIEENNVE